VPLTNLRAVLISHLAFDSQWHAEHLQRILTWRFGPLLLINMKRESVVENT